MQIGPNVSIGQNVQVAAGARIKESIVLNNSNIGANSLVLYAVIGKKTNIIRQCLAICSGHLSFYIAFLIRGRSQTTFTRQGRKVVQKCPLFVNVYTIENVNAGG